MVSKIAIVGSGTMGSGIAQVMLSSGYDVEVIAHSDQSLGEGMKRIESGFEKAINAKAITVEQKETYLKKLHMHVDYAAIKDAEFIIEAVSEIKEVKESVIKQVEVHANDSAIIATNTSSIPISSLQTIAGLQPEG